jgi:hypothetical protein
MRLFSRPLLFSAHHPIPFNEAIPTASLLSHIPPHTSNIQVYEENWSKHSPNVFMLKMDCEGHDPKALLMPYLDLLLQKFETQKQVESTGTNQNYRQYKRKTVRRRYIFEWKVQSTIFECNSNVHTNITKRYKAKHNET